MIHTCNIKAFGRQGNDTQEKLKDTRVALTSFNNISEMVMLGLCGLGIGSVMYNSDNKKPSIIKNDKNVNSDVKQELNSFSGIDIRRRHSGLDDRIIEMYNPDIIINTSEPKDYDGLDARTINVFSDRKRAIFEPKDKRLSGDGTGTFTSGIVAGLCLEQIRKDVYRHHPAEKDIEEIVYSIDNRDRFGEIYAIENTSDFNPADKKILLAGAGAIANWLSIYLALEGYGRIDFVDYDIAEEKNLNRQVQLRGKVGQKKSKILSTRTKRISSDIKSDYFVASIGEVKGQEEMKCAVIKKYDVIMGCLDNMKARRWLNDFSKEYDMPYIDGGTSTSQARANVFIPSMTRSLDEQMSLHEINRNLSCRDEPSPSIVMTNMISAGLMAGELRKYFSGDKTVESIHYDALNSAFALAR